MHLSGTTEKSPGPPGHNDTDGLYLLGATVLTNPMALSKMNIQQEKEFILTDDMLQKISKLNNVKPIMLSHDKKIGPKVGILLSIKHVNNGGLYFLAKLHPSFLEYISKEIYPSLKERGRKDNNKFNIPGMLQKFVPVCSMSSLRIPETKENDAIVQTILQKSSFINHIAITNCNMRPGTFVKYCRNPFEACEFLNEKLYMRNKKAFEEMVKDGLDMERKFVANGPNDTEIDKAQVCLRFLTYEADKPVVKDYLKQQMEALEIDDSFIDAQISVQELEKVLSEDSSKYSRPTMAENDTKMKEVHETLKKVSDILYTQATTDREGDSRRKRKSSYYDEDHEDSCERWRKRSRKGTSRSRRHDDIYHGRNRSRSPHGTYDEESCSDFSDCDECSPAYRRKGHKHNYRHKHSRVSHCHHESMEPMKNGVKRDTSSLAQSNSLMQSINTQQKQMNPFDELQKNIVSKMENLFEQKQLSERRSRSQEEEERHSQDCQENSQGPQGPQGQEAKRASSSSKSSNSDDVLSVKELKQFMNFMKEMKGDNWEYSSRDRAREKGENSEEDCKKERTQNEQKRPSTESNTEKAEKEEIEEKKETGGESLSADRETIIPKKDLPAAVKAPLDNKREELAPTTDCDLLGNKHKTADSVLLKSQKFQYLTKDTPYTNNPDLYQQVQ